MTPSPLLKPQPLLSYYGSTTLSTSHKLRSFAIMADNNNGSPTCYVCWDDESLLGNPIRRDCGCRGTAGFAHVKCVVRTVEAKENCWGLSALRSPPFLCNQCQQPFRSETYNQLKRASDALFPPPFPLRIPTLRGLFGNNPVPDEGDDDDEGIFNNFDELVRRRQEEIAAAQREGRAWWEGEANPFGANHPLMANPFGFNPLREAAIRQAQEARNRQARDHHQQQHGQRLQGEFAAQVQAPPPFVGGLFDDRQGLRNRRPNRNVPQAAQAQVRYIADDRGVIRPEANARAARPQRGAAQRQARRHQRDPAHGLVDPEDLEVHDWIDAFSRYFAPILKLGIIFIASAFVSMVLFSVFFTWLESTFGTRSVLEVIFKVIAESRAANHARPVLAPLAKLAVATKPHFDKAIEWSWRIFVKAAWMAWTYVGKPCIEIAWALGGYLLVGIDAFLTLAFTAVFSIIKHLSRVGMDLIIDGASKLTNSTWMSSAPLVNMCEHDF